MSLRFFILLLATTAAFSQSPSALERGFAAPPESTKPYTYWYWISGNVTREGITRDLEAMRRVGIGEAFVADVDALPNSRGPVRVLSPEWYSLVQHAIHEGRRLGVHIGVFNSPGWSQSGGPWVKPAQSMRFLTRSEIRVHGPARLSQKLAAPTPDFQDVALLAFPAPAAELDTLAAHSPRITATIPGAESLLLQPAASVKLPEKSSLTLAITTPAPYTARSLTVYTGTSKTVLAAEILAADAAGQLRSLRKFTVDRHNFTPTVGPIPYAPVVVALPPTTSTHFELRFSGAGELARLDLAPRAAVDSVYEKQLAKLFQEPQPAWDSYLWPRPPEPEPAFTVPTAGIRNISSSLAADGALTWDVPAGDWIVQRIGMSSTGVRNAPAPPEATGLEVDKMSRVHLTSLFNAYLGRIFERIPAADRPAWRHVVADSYEVGSENWTDDLARDFQARYHYDPLPWLAVLSGRVVGSADQSDRFLWDLRRLVADRIATHYVGALRDLAQQHGLRLWLENYGHWGFSSDFLLYGSQSHDIGGEFWTNKPLGQIEVRDAASAAHIYGKPVVHSESFTSSWNAFSNDPWRLKLRGDWAAIEGVNHVVFHVYTSQPDDRKPGLNWWAGIEMHRNNTWFSAAGAWIDYQRRRDFLLQQGHYAADIAYFTGDDAPKMTGSHTPAPPAGYAFDDINSDVILHRLAVRDGRFVLPDGVSYRVLVLPPLSTMRPELLRRLRQLVSEGGVILGAPPAHSPSLENYPAADREVAALAAELWRGCDGVSSHSVKFGRGRVFRNVDLSAVFAELRLPPDVSPDFPFIHRRTPEGDVYFLSNQSDEVVTREFTFRATPRDRATIRDREGADVRRATSRDREGADVRRATSRDRQGADAPASSSTALQPELWDAVAGSHRPLPSFRSANGLTTVELTFEPRQSHFIVFRRPAASTGKPNFPALQTLAEVPGPWQVTFSPEYGGPGTVTFDALADWTTRPEPGIRHYSGTAVYRTAFTAPAASGPVYLDLGSLTSLARVRLNGREVGTVWCAPWRLDVSSALRKGANELEIEVTNTWLNRILGDRANPSAPPIAPTSATISQHAKPIPAGLFGPVQLRSSMPRP